MEQILTISEYVIFAIMIGASIIALAVGIEKAILFSQITRHAKKIVPKIKNSFASGNINELEEFEKTYTQNIYAKFCSFIKLNYHKGELAIVHLINDRINEEKIFLERRLIVLGSLGNNAPFIGLLGTVFGIIKAFYSLGTLGNAGAEVVMKAIAVALVATAGGLLIAIPAVISNNYFNRRLKVMTQTMEQIAETALASYHIKEGDR